MSVDALPQRTPLLARVDRLGTVIVLLAIVGAVVPFVSFRANRIVVGEGVHWTASLPGWEALALGLVLAVSAAVALFRGPPVTRLWTSLAALIVLAIAVGHAASGLTPNGDKLSRTAPALGFWLLFLAFALLASDSVARLRLVAWQRLGLLALVATTVTGILISGLWNDISVLREYNNRADAFWREAATHVSLAVGSLVVAVLVGLPIGLLCYRAPTIRAVALTTLNALQTIPSIALFGLLIAPLAWLAANVPGAAAIGIAGIGVAPAMVALFLYSLLPVVANTVIGLEGVPAEANEAARGMGMTDRQRLLQVQLPLAFPSILTAIRIVLVQNIGLATIAALIGGGGLGVFVFQGVGQTAMDLVLLGAIPTVALAFAAAVTLDAVVELASRGGPH
jgi:osmoprotectant transport system permease protein